MIDGLEFGAEEEAGGAQQLQLRLGDPGQRDDTKMLKR